MVAIWRGKETSCFFRRGGGVRPLSVAPQFESSDVDGSSANGEAFESRVLCFPERFDLS
jgi:hypothetical protein